MHGGPGDPAAAGHDRVAITPEAAAVLRELIAAHGPLLFHQSGGCCDGSAPMCYPRGEFRLGARDVRLGEVEGTPVFIGGAQWTAWQHTTLTIDVVRGRGSGFSLEAPLGVRFLTRSTVCASLEPPGADGPTEVALP